MFPLVYSSGRGAAAAGGAAGGGGGGVSGGGGGGGGGVKGSIPKVHALTYRALIKKLLVECPACVKVYMDARAR